MKKLLVVCLAMASSMMAQNARIRVVHASPDAPAVDVLVNGAKVLEGIPFLGYSDYLSVPAGRYDIRVNVSGTENTVLRANPELSSGNDFTAIAVGKVANLELMLTADNNTEPAAGTVRLRAIHAAPGAPTVDIFATAPYGVLGSATLAGVPFKAVSDYLEVPAGTYQARVAVAGTKTVAIDSGRLPLMGGTVRTVIAVDAKGGGTPFAFLVLPDLR
ncbi:MAG: DUF4397 domain-containing protein [Bryobacterales bacterium]|nr:DUF4397 domain-containing protein [Bryobacterales bacterium]